MEGGRSEAPALSVGSAMAGPDDGWRSAEVGMFWRYIRSSVDRLADIAAALSEAELRWRPAAEAANSIGVLVAHTAGNLEENILGTLCARPIRRDRATEFVESALTGTALRDRWLAMRDEIEAALAAVDTASLDTPRPHPRRGELTGREVLLIVARHAAEHLGQAELTRDLLRAAGREARPAAAG